MNIEGNETIWGAIVAALLGVGAFLRRERVQNSAAATESSINEGHTAELKRLQEAVAQLQPLANRVALLEAQLTGVAVYCGMFLLCEECKESNKQLIAKLREILDPLVLSRTGISDATRIKDAHEFLERNYGKSA